MNICSSGWGHRCAVILRRDTWVHSVAAERRRCNVGWYMAILWYSDHLVVSSRTNVDQQQRNRAAAAAAASFPAIRLPITPSDQLKNSLLNTLRRVLDDPKRFVALIWSIPIPRYLWNRWLNYFWRRQSLNLFKRCLSLTQSEGRNRKATANELSWHTDAARVRDAAIIWKCRLA